MVLGAGDEKSFSLMWVEMTRCTFFVVIRWLYFCDSCFVLGVLQIQKYFKNKILVYALQCVCM